MGKQPRPMAGLARRRAQHKTGFLQHAIALATVAASAGSNDIFPRVRATTTARNNMVDAFRSSIAVLTTPTIAHKHGTSTHCHSGKVRHFNEVKQTHDRRLGESNLLGVKHTISGEKRLRLLIEREEERPTSRHNAERLVTRIEDKRSGHR